MDDTMLMLALFAVGALCFMVALGIVGVALYMLTQKQNAQQQPPQPAPTAAPASPAPSTNSFSMPLSTGGIDLAPQDEEMPTVVIAQPPQVRLPSSPDAGASQPAPPPSRRTAGATIIAFDDDDDE